MSQLLFLFVLLSLRTLLAGVVFAVDRPMFLRWFGELINRIHVDEGGGEGRGDLSYLHLLTLAF